MPLNFLRDSRETFVMLVSVNIISIILCKKEVLFWQVRDMWWGGDIRCVLLQGVYPAGEGSRWLPQNC